MTTYAVFKLLHLVAVVLFLGNTTLGLFWVDHAERTRDPKLIGHAMHGIIRSDRWFTMPGVFLILIGGVAAAMLGNLRLLSTGWIAGSIVMFSLSGLVFGVFLAPLQRRIHADAAHAVDSRALEPLLRRWHRLGWLSVLPLWLAVAMMVLKWPG
jgi:uncharacterized membrane protein